MKKFIAVTSFLFIFLLAVLPTQASHAFAAANKAPSLTGISLVTNKGEIKAAKSGNSFKFDLVGLPADQKIYKLVVTSDTAKTISMYPQGLDSIPFDGDLHFDNGVAYLDVAKYNNWYTSESQKMNDGKVLEEGLITTDYLCTVQDLRDIFAGADTADISENPSVFVADANGNETEITVMVATKGWKFNKKWYYFDEYGDKSTGWLLDGSKWYYLDKKTGEMQTGWKLDGGKWYFLDKKSGAMKTGWVLDGNKWYFLDKKSGAMKTGWLLDGGKWYYLNSNGSMATGWIKVSNKWYYLYSDGHMAANTKIGYNRLGKDGAWIR